MKDKSSFLLGLLGGLVVLGLLGAAWTQAGYEGADGVPGLITNSTPADQIDDYMRDERQEVRYRAEVEHFWGDGEILADDNGLHRLGSARCYMSNTAPTVLSDSHSGVPGAGASITDYLNSAGASFSGEEALNNPASLSAAGDEDDVGHGRCWIDLDGPDNSAGTPDDYKLYIFGGTAGVGGGPPTGCIGTGWCPVDAALRPDGDDEILAGAYNLVYNGSFEQTDGDGDPASTTVPIGWTVGGAPTIAYTNPTADTAYGDGYHVTVTDSGGGGDYIQIAIDFLGAGVFKVLARVESDGVDTCRLTTSGATADLANQDTTSAAWVTLSGTFTTVAVETVAIRLVSVTAGTDCDWDHVAVYRVGDVATDRPEINQPGVLRYRAEQSSADFQCDTNSWTVGGCIYATTGLFLTVTPPEGIFIIQLSYMVEVDADTGFECYVRLQDITNATTLNGGWIQTSGTTTTVHRGWDTAYASSGDTVVYALQVRSEPDPPADLDCHIITPGGSGSVNARLDGVLIPVR
jgi:hypothetical protein